MRARLLLIIALLGAAAAIATHPNARRIAFLVSALAGRAFPALRALGFPAFNGDGREEEAAAFVLAHAPPGNLSAAMAAFEAFASDHRWMMAVGPVKGAIVGDALRAAAAAAGGGSAGGPPLKVLELGTYCGYGAMLLASAAPASAVLYSVEVVPRFAAAARAILAHAGLGGRVTVLEGPLASHLPSLAALPPAGSPLDFVFVDHDKAAYLPDVRALLATPGLVRQGREGGTVLAVDNLRFPGAPAMVAWLRSARRPRWRRPGTRRRWSL